MRPLLLVSAVLAVPAAAHAEGPKETVAKAVKAAGWKPTDTAKTWADKGTIQIDGMKVPYTAKWWFAAPDKLRFEVSADIGGMKFDITHVVNGDKVWDAAMGRVEEVTGDKKAYSRDEVYQLWAFGLTPLLTDEGFKLSAAGEKDVGGKPAVGVKVERAGRLPLTIYFDKATGLMVKSETRVKDEFQGWKEVPEEAYYGGWKGIGDGAKVFTTLKVVRDGKPLLESELTDQKSPAKLDPKLFEKP